MNMSYEEFIEKYPTATYSDYKEYVKEQEESQKESQQAISSGISQLSNVASKAVSDTPTTNLGAASVGLQGAGAIASMVPGWGTAIGAGLSGIGAVLKMVDAKKQKKEAEKIQRKAEQVKKAPLEKEYLQTLRGQKMLALSGLPEYERAKQNIDIESANAAKNLMQSSISGATTADTLAAIINKGSQQKSALDVAQAQAKLGLQKDVLDTLFKLGGQQRELTKEQRLRKEALYSQAQDLMAASTANKDIGREQALGAGIMGVGALSKMIGSNVGGLKSKGATETTATGESATEPTGLQDTQSQLSTEGTNIGAKYTPVKLDPKDAAQLILKLKTEGKATTDTEALNYLRNLGFEL